MMIVKILGKIVVAPLVILITALLGILSTFGKIGGFFLGLFNLVIIFGAICAICATGSWDLPKQAFIFLVVENIIIAIAGFGIAWVAIVRDKLMGFLAA